MTSSYLMRGSSGSPAPLRESSSSMNRSGGDATQRHVKLSESHSPLTGQTPPAAPPARPDLEYVILMPSTSPTEEQLRMQLHSERQQFEREKERWRLYQQIEAAELQSREEEVARREQALDIA